METLTEKEAEILLNCVGFVVAAWGRGSISFTDKSITKEDLETIIKKLTGEDIK